MTWQQDLRDDLVARLPPGAHVRVTGSTAEPEQLDCWSDLDLHVDLPGSAPTDLLAACDVWAAAVEVSATGQVLRVVLADGRRLDLVVNGGTVTVPPLAADNDVRFMAALAAAKLGRGDHLIGLHLTLDLLRSCLVLAMQLRDRDLGTTSHRFGSEHDTLATEVTALLADPIEVTSRPNLVERTVALYATWRQDLEPAYEPDWSGLSCVIDRGGAAAGR